MRQPNIVFILMDDLGWADLTCYGSTFYETPNLDRLAYEGMFFTDAYASCPVCSPTRASIMTGRYPARVGVTQFIGGHGVGRLCDVPYHHELPHSEKALPAALREGGYQTWHVGKWHLGGRRSYPDLHGFDVNVAGCEWGMPGNGYFSPYDMPNLENGPEGEYLTDRLTDEAISLIENREADRPYFLNMSHYAVHIPIQSPPELVEKYEQKRRNMGLDDVPEFEEGEPMPVLHKKGKRVRRRLVQGDAEYAAMIENMDTNIGRLLDAVEATGEADNTIVIFTSDNGGLSTAEGSPTKNGPLAEGKGWMYEGGTREPLLVRWPAHVEAGSRCSTPVTSPDFYPTLLEAAGLDPIPKQHCDGESILPLLHGKGGLEERDIFWHYPHYGNQGGTPGCSMRSGDWKLIEFFEDGRLELYNLRKDLGEETNLVDSEPERAQELHARLVAWREEIMALIPRPNPWYAEQFAGRFA